MQTKRNIKSKPSKTDILTDILIILLTLLLFSYMVFLFMKNLNKTLTRTDKTQIATVTFKYKSVQRKFLDRAVWDRPMQHSPVYNGDTIRTSPDAAATLYFSDKNVVELGSNTMIQVFMKHDEAAVELADGEVAVKTAQNSKIKLTSKKNTVTLNSGSVLHAGSNNTGNLRLAMQQGTASFIEAPNSSDLAGNYIEKILTEGSVINDSLEYSITMITPSSKASILNQSMPAKEIDVTFKWQSSYPQAESIILETSSSSNFLNNLKSHNVTGADELTVKQKSGTMYWRIYPKSEGVESASANSGKVNIVAAPVPVLLDPPIGKKFTYYEKLPSINFYWKGNNAAASYLLEVADNPQMNNPYFSRFANTESLTVAEFGEGSWYWRVTPHYLTNAEKEEKTSEIYFFHVERTNSVLAPELHVIRGAVTTAKSKSVTFSWNYVSDASQYRVKISKNENMAEPVVDRVVDSNYIEIQNSAEQLPKGEYYWTVSALDEKGTMLSTSEQEKFITQDTVASLRTVFPPDGYLIADTLCCDTRFTWKSSIKDEHIVQFSSSPDFKTIAIEKKLRQNGIDGIELSTGEWYWRVAAFYKGNQIKTEPKKFSVIPPFKQPEFLKLRKTVIVLPDKRNKFIWKGVPEADYYQVKITKSNINEDPIYENLFVTKTEIETALNSIKEGSYIINVQGFSYPKLTATRRYSFKERKTFELRRLRPIELLQPHDRTKIAGEDAAFRPISLIWKTFEKPAESTFIVEKTGRKKPVVIQKNPSSRIDLHKLEPGRYTWRVTGKTIDGFDISSPDVYSFTVLPIVPLSAANFILPSVNQVFDTQFFKENRNINFQWTSVRNATVYMVKITDTTGNVIVKTEIPAKNKNSNIIFNFTDIILLSRGVFYIEVKAQNRLKNGFVFQDGTVSRRMFEISLPQLESPKLNNTGVMYGK